MHDPANLLSASYTYELPSSRIALYPADPRDSSRVLICRGEEPLGETRFEEIDHYLPPSALLVLNNTRVLHARLEFFKASGARIEIFCLNPLLPETDMEQAFTSTTSVVWNCLIGNSKRWKSGILTKSSESGSQTISLSAERLDTEGQVRFSWSPDGLPFAEIIRIFGEVPLPPYIERKHQPSDNQRYQTVYAEPLGSVAAPTAGLHFTPKVFSRLEKKNIQSAFLTLHVGAGTFKPLTSDVIGDHTMHSEEVFFSRTLVSTLLEKHSDGIFAVGTTSMRSLESLYWLGVNYIQGKMEGVHFDFGQWEAYHLNAEGINREMALRAVLDHMDTYTSPWIRGFTRLMIAPGYTFKMVDGLITNFHQPGSTLLLLVAAFAGERWREVYAHALAGDFRFLSYGDACLFVPSFRR